MSTRLLFLSTILPSICSGSLTAIPFGRDASIQTLVPILPTIDPSLSYGHDTAVRPIPTSGADKIGLMQQLMGPDPISYIGSQEDVTSSINEEDIEPTPLHDVEAQDNVDTSEDLYIEVGSTEMQTLVRRASKKTPTIQRKPVDAGTMHIDCLLGPEICNNVCWYQNCVYGQKGEVEYPTYQIGGTNKGRNRVSSGVTTSKSAPCRALPFGQKFYDTFPFTEFDLFDNTPPKKTKKGKDKGDPRTFLDTDEWPMADFEQDPWIDGVQQHVLRCMTDQQNQVGQRAYSNFKAGISRYNIDSQTGQPRDWAVHRNIPPNQPLIRFDSFKVQPDFESFKNTGNKEEDERQAKILETIKWCRPATGSTSVDCKNDGRQFHMTKLVTNGPKASQGYISEPYSSAVSSIYQVDDMDGNGKDIEQYHVKLIIIGDKVGAEVFKYDKQVDKDNGGKWWTKGTRLAIRDGANGENLVMKDGDAFDMKGNLPRTLKVRRRLNLGSGCGTFEFTYADAQREPLRAFKFHSRNKGHVDTKGLYPDNKYCDEKAIKKKDANGDMITVGTNLYCSFPGW